MDCRSLKPGQNWPLEIDRALNKATFVLAFVSKFSFDRRGYVQRELKVALDKLTEKLADDIYIIPVILDDDSEIPEQLRSLQCIRASDPRCQAQIADAIRHQLERLGFERREVQEKEQLYWTSSIKREEWDGIPGYEVELQFLEFHSYLYPNATEIGDYLKRMLLTSLFEHRADKFKPSPDSFNYGQDRFSRTHTYDAHCTEPVIVGKVVSIQYSIHWYGARAAHPNQHFQTYSFLLEPLILIESLSDIFREPDVALVLIQALVRDQLYELRFGDGVDDEAKLDPEMINDGTQEWKDFSSFVFRPEGVRILFAPYQVAPYAVGPQSAEIPYEKIKALMHAEYLSALGITH